MEKCPKCGGKKFSVSIRGDVEFNLPPEKKGKGKRAKGYKSKLVSLALVFGAPGNGPVFKCEKCNFLFQLNLDEVENIEEVIISDFKL